MYRAKSIDVKSLTAAAQKSAQRAVSAHGAAISGDISIGVFPDIGTVGLIWRNPDFDALRSGDLMKTSAGIVEGMADFAPDVEPVVSLLPDRIIFGYFPSGPIEFGPFR